MAITTVDGLLAGMQFPRLISKALSGTLAVGRQFSAWGFAGIPGAGSFDTTLDGVALSAPQSGALPFANPGAGNTYLNRLLLASSGGGGVMTLADRLWHNGGFTITSTSAQNITSPTWPARDAVGSTNGEGVFLAVEISAATGSGTPTITVSYTNSAGTSGRTATNIEPTAASSIAGSFYRIALQSGDVGVRSVQSVTLSATWSSGTMNLVAYRPICSVVCNGADIPGVADSLTGGLPRLFDNSVLWPIWVPGSTTAARIHGMAQWSQG